MSNEWAQVRYRGAVTVGSPGRVYLHDRDGGLVDLVWEALGQAGWLEHKTGIKPTVDAQIRVSPAPASRHAGAPHFAPLPGGVRRDRERGWADNSGAAYQRYVGPLPRFVPGIRLVDGERRAEDFDFLEDMIYKAVTHAGWSVEDHTAVEVPDIELLIGITRRSS